MPAVIVEAHEVARLLELARAAAKDSPEARQYAATLLVLEVLRLFEPRLLSPEVTP